MNYTTYIHKAGDGNRVAYAYLIQNDRTGEYTEHLIVMRQKEANDHRAFQQILRKVATMPNVHRVSIVVNESLVPLVYQLTDVEPTDSPQLNETTKWLMKRFYKCDFEGGNGEEPQEIAVIDAAVNALEQRDSLIKRFKNVMGELFYGTKEIG